MTSTNTKGCQNTRPYTTFTCNRIQHTALTRNRTYCPTFTRIRSRPLTRACTLTGPRSRNSLLSLYDRTIIWPIFMYPGCPERRIRFSYCYTFIITMRRLNNSMINLTCRRFNNFGIHPLFHMNVNLTPSIIVSNIASFVHGRAPTLSNQRLITRSSLITFHIMRTLRLIQW